VAPEFCEVLEEERSGDQGDRAEKFDEHVDGRACGVLEWIADGIAHNGSLVSF
jgi:hypothetical protein